MMMPPRRWMRSPHSPGFSSSYQSKGERKKGDLINSNRKLEIWDDGRRARSS